MSKPTEPEIREAVEYAVRYAISLIGIEGLRKTSMFPSNERISKGFKQAA
jgi:hypothetical protein